MKSSHYAEAYPGYAVQVMVKIDAEIGQKGHLWKLVKTRNAREGKCWY